MPVDEIAWFGIAIGTVGLIGLNGLGWHMLRRDRKLREQYGLPRRR